MEKHALHVGIVIPFYNGYDHLGNLLNSINVSASNLNCTVFIIENSSDRKEITTGSNLDIIVNIIKEKPRLGYGKACNVGYELCCKNNLDYMIIANQDGYFSRNMIELLLQPFKADNNIQMTAPLVHKYGSDEMEEFFIQYYISQVPTLVADLFNKNVKTFYEIPRVSGACFAFNLKNKKYGYNYLFDPLFHMYWEDEDLCRRVHMTGAKIALVPAAVFYHLHSYTTDTENKEEIKSNDFYSEMIYSLKDPSGSVPRILYSIFVNVCHLFIFFFLKGQWKKCFLQIKAMFVMLFNLPAIIKSRKNDMQISDINNQNYALQK